MSIPYSELDQDLQDMLASTANIKADSAKRMRIMNQVLDRLQSKYNWSFTLRKNVFDYLVDLTEYNIENLIGISDFKDLYSINGVPMTDKRWFKKFKNVATYKQDGSNYLKLFLEGGKGTVINALSSITDNGTWTASDDANSLTEDGEEYKEGSGSLKFNMGFATGYGTLENSTFTVKDLSDYEDRSYFLLWVYLPTVTNLTSVSLDWGDDGTANFWRKTETKPANKSAFEAGSWNLMAFKWEDATETGTPDSSSVNYLRIRINTTFTGATNNFRVNWLALDERKETDLEYFSSYMVKTTVGVWQKNFINTTDIFLGDDNMKTLLLEYAFYLLQRFTRKLDKSEIQEANLNLNKLLYSAKQSYGFSTNLKTSHIQTMR